MVIKELLKDAIAQLRCAGNDNPVFEAHQIVRHSLKISATDLVLMHDKKITKKRTPKGCACIFP